MRGHEEWTVEVQQGLSLQHRRTSEIHVKPLDPSLDLRVDRCEARFVVNDAAGRLDCPGQASKFDFGERDSDTPPSLVRESNGVELIASSHGAVIVGSALLSGLESVAGSRVEHRGRRSAHDYEDGQSDLQLCLHGLSAISSSARGRGRPTIDSSPATPLP